MLAASACGPAQESAEASGALSDAANRPALIAASSEPSCASEPPTLTITGGAAQTLECGSGTYSDPGAQAFDGCGEPLEVFSYNTGTDDSGPGPLLAYEGVYYVGYNAWNSQGGLSATRTVTVDDRTAPTLTLLGPAFMTHTCNSQWVDPGVEATDACDLFIAGNITRTGEVNSWAEGTYTVIYSVTDAGGNSAPSVSRTVEVVDCPW
jgi:hypothetical protein